MNEHASTALGEAGADLLGLVGAGICRGDVNVEIVGDVLLDKVEEVADLLGAVPRQIFVDDLAVGDVQRGKQ